MYILLVAATTAEIQPAIDFLEGIQYKLGDHDIELLIAGVGSLSTSYLLTYNIGTHRPDIILQAGIAGCFTSLATGTVVAVEAEILGDLGVWEENRFKTVFDMQLADPESAPFSGGRLVNPYNDLFSLSSLESVTACTVNEISTRPEKIEWLNQIDQPVVESMEGAAFHFVCLQEEIPFLQIRAVSNPVGERDKSKWNIPLAISNLNDQLIALFKALEPFSEF